MERQVSVRFEEYARTYDASFEGHVYPNPSGLSVFMSNITERKRIEERLLDVSQRLQFHSENSPLAVVEFSPDFHIIRWSKEAERIFRWKAEEVLGKGMREIPWIHPEDKENVEDIAQAMMSREQPRNVHSNRNLRKDGEVVWCVWHNSTLYDNQGRMQSILSLVHDVTAERTAQEVRMRAEAVLRESESRYRSLFENAQDAIFLTLPDGRVLAANPAACAMFGRSNEELCQGGRDAIFGADDPELDAAVEERSRAGQLRTELTCLRRDGTPFRAEVSSVVLPGETPRSFVMLRDISQRKRAEEALRESEERFRYLADAMPQLVWTAGPDGQMDYVNRRVSAFSGIRLEDGMWSWETAVHQEDRPGTLDAWTEAVRTGETYHIEHRLRGADGSYGWFLSRAIPQRDAVGRIVKWYGTSTDIQELKEAEAALADAGEAKDQFLAMLAHELRNPLGAISNAAALIAIQAEGRKELHKPVEILNRQVRHTARLVDDLLDVSRITYGKFELRKELVDLLTVLHRAVETVRPQMEMRRHAFAVDLPAGAIWLEADPVRLEQVAGNLLTNAAKYTNPGGSIALSLTVEGETAEIRVQDNGTGIRPEMLPCIFDLFAQEDRSLDRCNGGLGIGLTMVNNLVEMHGGSVEAASQGAGCGSTFTVRLPIMVSAAEIAESPVAVPQTQSRKILVVDDIVDGAQAIADLLEAFGHQVVIAHDGPTAIEAAHQFRPDTILLDIGLPGMDGYEVARCLRASESLAGTRLVAMTGYGQEKDRRRSEEAGFDHHLVKPVDLDLLQKLLACNCPLATVVDAREPLA